jgi:sortase A
LKANKVLNVASLGIMVVGLSLLVLGFAGVDPSMIWKGDLAQKGSGGFGDLAPTVEPSGRPEAAGGPKDKALELTVPKMQRIDGVTVPDAPGDNERKLDSYAAVHLRGTGFPWEKGANVYVVGHRLGYPNTDSFLAFYDQDKLKKGDEVFVTDSEGREYEYRVYESFIVDASEVWVTEPVPGKSVLTLQTCTLPDYSRRIVTRAELVKEV